MSREAGDEAAAELEAASAWRARIARNPDLAENPAFLAWLADPDNRARYAEVARAWAALDMIAATPQVLAARQGALRALRRKARDATDRRRAAAGLAIAASLLMAILGGLQAWRHSFPFQTYATGLQERHVVRLADGSRIALDSETRLQVRYSPGARRITLEAGQASFTVAHDRRRPFRVTTPSRVVVATGTVFNIDLFGPRTTVTLVKGGVLVSHVEPSERPRPVALRPGQQLVATGQADAVRAVDAAQAGAWEQGKVVFDDEDLTAAISRFNRYAHRRWRVDPALSGLKISGVFETANPDAFIDAVTTYFHLEAAVAADGAVVLRPARPRAHEEKVVGPLRIGQG
jgi:transmembrane sensor